MDRYEPKCNTYFTYRPVSSYPTGHLAYNTVGMNYNFVCCTLDICATCYIGVESLNHFCQLW